MYEEPGILQFDHPLCFEVQSNDPRKYDTWYCVDLSQLGSPGNPKGECNCMAGCIAAWRIENGKPWRMCSHLERARSFVAERVRRGDYDEYLTTYAEIEKAHRGSLSDNGS